MNLSQITKLPKINKILGVITRTAVHRIIEIVANHIPWKKYLELLPYNKTN
jgi:hypothetical protein